MADAKGPVFNPIDDLKAIVFIFVILWLFWFSTGGPKRYEEAEMPFLKPPVTGVDENDLWRDPDLDEQYGNIAPVDIKGGVHVVGSYIPGTSATGAKPADSSTGNTDVNPTASDDAGSSYNLLTKPVVYLSKGPADASGKSFLKIDLPTLNMGYLKVTGLMIKNIFGQTTTIPGASPLPYQGQLNPESEVIIGPGSSAYLIEGVSPIGVSFRTNKCIGLLAKFQTFFPPLPLSSMHGLTYNVCVELHKSDPDFYYNDWRIYLKNRSKAWGETGDLIRLVNSLGYTLVSMLY